METTKKQKRIFLVIAILALIWNLIGVLNFIGTAFMRETLAESYTPAETELFLALPAWYLIFFGIATMAGLFASITMLMHKKSTVLLFLISLLAVLVTQAYWLLGTNIMEVMGTVALIMPIVVIVIAIFLYLYSKRAQKRGLLH